MRKNKDGFGKSRSAGFSICCCLTIVFGILVIAAVFVFFRLRGGVQVKPQQSGATLPDAEAVLYRQDDERWRDDRLGDSEYTLSSSGCLVSCIASAVSMECGEERPPAALNTEFSAAQVYDSEGNLQWEALAKSGGYRVDTWQNVSSDIIDSVLTEGRYPIVRVRMYGLGNVHYVLIVGAEDGEYQCMDPLRDETTGLSAYGNRVYAVRCVSLDGFPESVDALPFEQAMEMTFCSGAGGWQTCLVLNPDGSFYGEYADADMGVVGEGYPNGTQYVCRFHGRFGEITKISDASFSLVLKELVTDTGYPVGEEWIEDGVRYVSCEPYGMDGADGKALRPGAEFLFYLPEATGHEAGTELYGAAEFCSWRPERREFLSEKDKLGCYGLHNLETGYGFFSE